MTRMIIMLQAVTMISLGTLVVLGGFNPALFVALLACGSSMILNIYANNKTKDL